MKGSNAKEMKVKFCWQKGAITVEELPGGNSFLFRFHISKDSIPGDVLSNCVVAAVDEFEAEVKAWGGRRGPLPSDKSAIAEFCHSRGFTEVYWWRAKNGKPPVQRWLYQQIAGG